MNKPFEIENNQDETQKIVVAIPSLPTPVAPVAPVAPAPAAASPARPPSRSSYISSTFAIGGSAVVVAVVIGIFMMLFRSGSRRF